MNISYIEAKRQTMKQTEEEKSLLELFREMESRTIQDELLALAGAMVRAQRALKEDYGLVLPRETGKPQDAA